VRLLRSAGYEVVCLKEIARRDTPDDDVLRLAVERSMLLLTNDKDFADVLRYPPGAHAGIVVLRIMAVTEAEVHAVLLRLLTDHKPEALNATLAVVSRRKYRLKR